MSLPLICVFFVVSIVLGCQSLRLSNFGLIPRSAPARLQIAIFRCFFHVGPSFPLLSYPGSFSWPLLSPPFLSQVSLSPVLRLP